MRKWQTGRLNLTERNAIRSAIVLALATALMSSNAHAQLSSGSYSIDTYVLDGAGGGTISAGSYSIISSTAQPGGAGSASSGSYAASFGFIAGLFEAVPPTTPAISLSPASPKTTDPIVCTITAPTNVHPSLTAQYEYRWSNGLVSIVQGPTTQTNATLDAQYTKKAEVWTCSVKGYDGISYSATAATAQRTIQNTLPTAPVISIPTLQSDAANIVVTVTTNSTDADNDMITCEYDWFVRPDGAGSFTPFGGAIDGSGLSLVLAADTDPGDTWYCVVTPNDPDGAGTETTSAQCNVVAGGITPSSISIQVNPTTITLGQSLTASGTIFPSPVGATIVEFTTVGPDNVSNNAFPDAIAIGSANYARTFVPTQASEGRQSWTITSNWDGDATYQAAVSPVTSFVVLKAHPTISLSLSSSSAPVGYTNLTATATMTAPIPSSLNGLLNGRTIKLYLRKPDGTSLGPVNGTTNASGVATFAPSAFSGAGIAFDTPGTWQFIADFEGDNNFKPASSPSYDQPDSVRFIVKDGAGYAIIAVGKLDATGEGVSEHNKTADKVYLTLRDRGFADEDIYYLRQGTAGAGIVVDDISPTQADLQNAITNWALTNMNAAPGPLYLILLDHGLEEQYYIYGGSFDETRIVTPIELDGYLNMLEAALNANASGEPITVVYGACHSGSFIPDLSAPGRAIVSSAAFDEKSHRGPADPDGVRDGEIFVTELFRNLGLGKPLKESFELAGAKIREYTEDRSNGAQAAAAQTPQLDDNGDGIGTTFDRLGFESGLDGALAHAITLGFGVNSGESIGWINATQTVVLGPADPVGFLFARSQTPIPNGTEAWLEVKTPAYTGSTVPPGGASSTQVVVDMPVFDYEPGISNLTNGTVGGLLPGTFRWQTFNGVFDNPGTYKVFYYVKDGDTNEVSAHLLTTIYRQSAVNQEPTAPVLQYPADNATTLSAVFLAWTASTDPDAGPDLITYRVELAEDNTFTTGLITKDNITATFATMTSADGIVDGKTYYWRVFAFDEFGLSSAASNVRVFHVDNTNNVIPGVIAGRVIDVVGGTGINGASITVTPGNFAAQSGADGTYYVTGVPAGSKTVTSTKSGYTASPLLVSVSAGQLVTQDIHMTSTSSYRWGDVSADAIAGTYDASLILQWIAYPLPGGIDRFPINPLIIKPAFPAGANVNANADALLNTLDVSYLLQYKVKLIEKLPADTNGDGLGPDAKSRSKAVRGETTRTISVPAVTNVEPGQTVDVAIELDDAEGVAGMEVRLDYDVTVLDVLEVVPGSLFQGWGNPIMGAAGGQVIVVAADASELPAGSGTIAIVRFQAKAEAEGLSSSLTFSTAYLNNLQAEIPSTAVNGVVHVVGDAETDINGDTVVDAVDVQLVINAALDIDIGGLNGDVNGDGGIDAIDVQLVVNDALGIR